MSDRLFDPHRRGLSFSASTIQYPVTFAEQDAICHWPECLADGINVIVAQGGGRIAAYCDEHLYAENVRAERAAAHNVATKRARAFDAERAKGGA